VATPRISEMFIASGISTADLDAVLAEQYAFYGT
jgi:hypothetical protein